MRQCAPRINDREQTLTLRTIFKDAVELHSVNGKRVTFGGRKVVNARLFSQGEIGRTLKNFFTNSLPLNPMERRC
jgi:hypothetical protein